MSSHPYVLNGENKLISLYVEDTASNQWHIYSMPYESFIQISYKALFFYESPSVCLGDHIVKDNRTDVCSIQDKMLRKQWEMLFS